MRQVEQDLATLELVLRKYGHRMSEADRYAVRQLVSRTAIDAVAVR